MRLGRTTKFLAAGVGAAGLLALSGCPDWPGGTARAQSRANATRPDQAPAAALPLRGTIDPRRAVSDSQTAQVAQDVQAAEDSDAEPVDQGTEPSATADDPGPTRLPAPVLSLRELVEETAGLKAGEGEGEPDPDVGNNAGAMRVQRPVDGDLAASERVQLRDGDVAPDQPQISADGDPALVDALAENDNEAHTALRADNGSPLTQASPIQPLVRPTFGPYQPVGIRVGSFFFFPELQTGARATNNLFHATTGTKSDVGLEFQETGRLVSNWSRHAFELRVAGSQTYYDSFPSENDNRLNAQARARLDITRRTNLIADLGYGFGQESRGSVNVSSSLPERPNVIVKNEQLALNHQISRINLQLRGGLSQYDYSTVAGIDPATGRRAILSGPDRNYQQWEIGARAGYALSSGLIVFADGSTNQRHHDIANLSDGISRNSEGYRVRAGATVNLRGNLQGEASLGYAEQAPNDARLKPVEGFIAEGTLDWQPTGLTNVRLTARSDAVETTLANTSGALARGVGLEARHAFQKNLILIAGASLTISQYAGNPLQERDYQGQLGAEYYLTRALALIGEYRHDHFETNQQGRDYDEDLVRVGVRIRR